MKQDKSIIRENDALTMIKKDEKHPGILKFWLEKLSDFVTQTKRDSLRTNKID